MVKVEHRDLNNGHITIAYDIDDNAPQIHYALSFCSPLDCFSRKRGKLIAEGRLKAYRDDMNRSDKLVDRGLCGSLPITTNHVLEPKKREVIDRIFDEVATKKFGPDQIRWAPLARGA